MTVNWDINPVSVATFAGGIIGILYRLHKAETRTEITTEVRHVENLNRFSKLETSHDEIKRDLKDVSDTQKECQRRITDTREMVIRLEAASKRG